MREHSSATTRRRVADSPLRRLLGALARAWQDGVHANELMLGGPWEREGDLRWRRERGGYRLTGATAPRGGRAPVSRSVGDRIAQAEAARDASAPAPAPGPARPDDPEVSRRSG